MELWKIVFIYFLPYSAIKLPQYRYFVIDRSNIKTKFSVLISDFLYIRKNKIIESAYFMEFTKFSRDVDRFYKDITGNNTVEAIYKYGNIVWNFVNEKYINHAPFGKELKAVISEIIAELKQLGDVPSIKYALEKCNEVLDSVKYYYKYFEVEYRAHRVIKFIYKKLSEMTVTALEMENRSVKADNISLKHFY